VRLKFASAGLDAAEAMEFQTNSREVEVEDGRRAGVFRDRFRRTLVRLKYYPQL